MNVFLSIPIQGQRLNYKKYEVIISVLKELNHNILNINEISNLPSLNFLTNANPEEVYLHDINLLNNCDMLIAEITNPSLGVGYELAKAESMGIPVLYLYNEKRLPFISLMIRGTTYANKYKLGYVGVLDLKSQFTELMIHLQQPNAHMMSVINHFDIKSKTYNEEVNWRKDSYTLNWFKDTLKNCQLCLDVGTGTGIIGSQLRKKSSFVIGLDLSDQMLKEAKDNLDLLVVGNATNLPFVDDQFDGACLRQVFHYVDDVKCIQEINRILKINGLFACAQVTTSSNELYNWWAGIKPIVQPLRMRVYTNDNLIDLFKLNGFEIIQTKVRNILRRDKFSSFLMNAENPINKSKALDYLYSTDPFLTKELGLKINEDSLEYNQEWIYILGKKMS